MYIQKKITQVDYMIIHNFVIYFVQTQLRLLGIKTIFFKLETCIDARTQMHCGHHLARMFP
jgi:hypothetical protein